MTDTADLVKELREKAATEERALRSLTDAAFGPSYRSTAKEHTVEWRAADALESTQARADKLEKELAVIRRRGRDMDKLARLKIEQVVSEISFTLFPNWKLKLGDDNGRPYLQVIGQGACNITGKPIKWTGRKWMLSVHMTKSEIIYTAFKAYQAAVDHEFRENFRYKGALIFDPHRDVEALVALEGKLDVRT